MDDKQLTSQVDASGDEDVVGDGHSSQKIIAEDNSTISDATQVSGDLIKGDKIVIGESAETQEELERRELGEKLLEGVSEFAKQHDFFGRQPVRVGRYGQVIRAEAGSTISDVVQIIGDVYTRSQAEELRDYLARAVADYERRMYRLVASPAASPDQPYKFLYAFEIKDAHIFFGRDAATEELYERVLNDRLTVLHARSGAGKTSLLNAGLSPRLIREGRLPVYARTRAYEEDPTLAVKRSVAPPSLGPWPELLPNLSLHEFLGLVCINLSRETRELVIIFDQFEEFLVSLPEPDLRLPFIKTLSDCYEDQSLPVRFVIALRRENLWDLDEFQPIIPHILQNRYGLPPMSQTEVAEAITGPFLELQKDVSFEPVLVETLLNDLGRADVELTHLQIVCTKLYESLPEGEKVITVGLYESLGKTETILITYLNEVLEEKLRPQLRVTARNTLKALVSSKATNRVLSLSALQKQVPQDLAFLQSVLERLVDERLVHRDDASSVLEYELAHDYLAEEISHWISQDELRVKETQELLQRELASWRVHKTLVDEDRLDILRTYVEYLDLDDEAQRLLLQSALHQGHEVSFWVQQVEDRDWSMGQVAEQLVENKRLRKKIARDLRSNLDQSLHDSLASPLWEVFNDATGVSKRNAARSLWALKSWLSFGELRRVLIVLGPVWAFQLLAVVLVSALLYQGASWAWPFLSRERAIPGRWMTIPAGSFVMGVDKAGAEFTRSLCLDGALNKATCPELEGLLEWSSRRNDAELPEFDIMDNEVTQAQYKRCIDEGPCKESDEWTYDSSDANKPAPKVDWHEAMTYCNWLAGRLPTEEEWEKAARGPEGNYFPWGNTWDPVKANLEHSKSGSVQSIATYAKTDVIYHGKYGVKNLAGNVQEWTASEYVAFSSVPFENDVLPLGIDDSINIVLRGGAWGNPRSEGMGSKRGASWASQTRKEIGFRCACPPGLTCKSPWDWRWIWFGEY